MPITLSCKGGKQHPLTPLLRTMMTAPCKMTKPAFRLPLLPPTQNSPGELLPGRHWGRTHTQRNLTCDFAVGFRGRLPIYNYGPRFPLFTHDCHILGWRSRNYKITILSVISVHFNFIHHFLNSFHLEGTIKVQGNKDKAS